MDDIMFYNVTDNNLNMWHLSFQWIIKHYRNKHSTNITPHYRSGIWDREIQLVSHFYDNVYNKPLKNHHDLPQMFLFRT